MTHIQKMAPGPPVRIAPDAPTILPVPTCSRNGGGERLEGAHAALLLSAAETEAAEHAVPALLEVTDLHEAGL